MRVLLSGEGPTDLGTCTNAQGACEGNDFRVGPMTVLFSQVAANKLGYDMLTTPDSLSFVSESELCALAKTQLKHNPAFRGKKLGVETRYYFDNAMMLGTLAKQHGSGMDKSTLAVLFRDSDGTRSSSDCRWTDMWSSMNDGFRRSGFEFGVPMLPKPKSEAWLLSVALPHIADCAKLEDVSGNDNAPNSAKSQLDAALGEHKSAEELCDWLVENPIDTDRACTMPSFAQFKKRLDEVLQNLTNAQSSRNGPPADLRIGSGG